MDTEKIIPRTKLHYFYDSLSRYPIKSQIVICENLKENLHCLLHLYIDACKDFSRYSNIKEAFVHFPKKRKPLKISRNITKTTDLLALLDNQKELKVKNSCNLSFEYIEREINPWRTRGTMFENGVLGKRSGTGGLDFIGINKNNNPILGEVKIKNDKNAFYAFIQLLTYCSELFTKNQIERIKSQHLFGKYKIEPPVSLYIVLHEHNPEGATHQLIEKTSNLAKSFQEEIISEKSLNSFQKIGHIACLESIVVNRALSFVKCWDV